MPKTKFSVDFESELYDLLHIAAVITRKSMGELTCVAVASLVAGLATHSPEIAAAFNAATTADFEPVLKAASAVEEVRQPA
jgi:hypothetical protein